MGWSVIAEKLVAFQSPVPFLLLFPAQVGLSALAILYVNLVFMFFSFGLDSAFIHRPQVDEFVQFTVRMHHRQAAPECNNAKQVEPKRVVLVVPGPNIDPERQQHHEQAEP